jgi:parvulin-like peptidyl-prolyl isomerase
MVKSLLREPLMHFLLLGLALFALDAWLRPTTSVATRSEIVVSEARIRNLAQNFSRTWQRPPTREELDGLVESFIREEVMVREAVAVGLDRDDAIIRRRLQQKMEFVSEEAAALARPTDAELSTYLQANPDAFRKEPRVTFVQIYLDPRKRMDSLQADARRLIDTLNRAGSSPDLARFGDTLMLLEARYENATQAELARLFGNEFADVIVKQPTGRWVGPIASGYGAHLVRVESVTPGGTPALEEVRPALEREWANAKRQELSQAFYGKLRAKYAIKVTMPEAAKP